MSLAIVTASFSREAGPEGFECQRSWRRHSQGTHTYYNVVQAGKLDKPWNRSSFKLTNAAASWYYQTPMILGPVAAFALGVQKALEDGAEIIACLHDDLLIEHPGWDALVLGYFTQNPACGLLGFGGGTGLGRADIYRSPYDPMQLARQDFVSNMRDAESHGRRSTAPVRVACLDGFSQIGRRAFWEGVYITPAFNALKRIMDDALDTFAGFTTATSDVRYKIPCDNLFALMQSWGVVHHFYDSALGAYARRLGWETWMLPIACHHFGGRTAVGDPRYAAWAGQFTATEHDGTQITATARGDAAFWRNAHYWGYHEFKDVLPFTVQQP